MLNVLVLVGRVSKTPELRKADDGTIYGSFDIAVDNLHGKKNEKSASFFQVKIFGKLAENVGKHVNLGSKVGIQGSIEQRSWKREDGTTKVVYDVYADSVEFLDPKPEVKTETNKAEPKDAIDQIKG